MFFLTLRDQWFYWQSKHLDHLVFWVVPWQTQYNAPDSAAFNYAFLYLYLQYIKHQDKALIRGRNRNRKGNKRWGWDTIHKEPVFDSVPSVTHFIDCHQQPLQVPAKAILSRSIKLYFTAHTALQLLWCWPHCGCLCLQALSRLHSFTTPFIYCSYSGFNVCCLIKTHNKSSCAFTITLWWPFRLVTHAEAQTKNSSLRQYMF